MLRENLKRRDSFLPEKPAPGDDAAPLYRRAFQSIEDEEQPEWWYRVTDSDFDMSTGEVRAFVQETEKAMALLREAVEKPACYLKTREPFVDRDGRRLYTGYSLDWEDTRWICDLPRVAALHARYNARAGNADGAREALRVIDSFPSRVTSAPSLIGRMTIATQTGVLAAAVESVLAELPASRHSALLGALTAPPSFWARTREMLAAEQVFWLIALASFEQPALSRIFVIPGVLEAHQRAFGRIQELSARPYHEVRDRLQALDRPLERRRSWTDVEELGAIILLKKAVANDAKHALARLGLAVAAFRAQRGSYPKHLDDLVPDFLEAVPTDPGDGKPLKVLEVDGGLVLYSAGTDGVDDGGEEGVDITFCLGAAYQERRRTPPPRTWDEDPVEALKKAMERYSRP
jgi:hypothetical protein